MIIIDFKDIIGLSILLIGLIWIIISVCFEKKNKDLVTMSINKHPLDIINERLENGYYAKMPPYSYSKDAATVCYLLGYCSKVEYQVVKSKYDMFNWNYLDGQNGH